MTHLTERTHSLLLQGALPSADVRMLARHLEQPCAACEEFLASLPTADAADGLVDGALDALAPAGGRGHDLEFARIERALREGARERRRPPRRAVPAVIAAAVLAAGLAGVVAPRAGGERPAWDGMKGASPRAAAVRLRFLVVTPEPAGPPSLERGVSGRVVGAGASLQFEIESVRTAQAALVRVPSGGPPELFWSERVGPGRSQVTAGGRPAAYPLAELAGTQRFVLLASEAPIEPGRLARAAAAFVPPANASAEAGSREGLSVDVVEVEVR